MSKRVGEFRLWGRESGQFLGHLTEWVDEDLETTAWELNEFYNRTKHMLATLHNSDEGIEVEYVPDPPKLTLIKSE